MRAPRPTSPENASPSTAAAIRSPTSAKTPAAAAIGGRQSHEPWTTCSTAASASTPRRVSSAVEMIESEVAVAATSTAAKKYAYESDVTAPTPIPEAPRSAIR